MGLTVTSLEFIAEHKDLFHGKDIATLGVLYPYIRSKGELKKVKLLFPKIKLNSDKFAEHLFCELLGASSYSAIDVSEYQGANVIIDLNKPISKENYDRFDIIYDAGTFEHLSNLQQALMNIFNVLKVNGACIFGQPCNGWVDHGFYQFSPTFYSDLCYSNDILDLVEFNLTSTNGNSISLLKKKQAAITAFVSSYSKVNVGGIIQKTGRGEITLDFIQEKYRVWHETGDRTKDSSVIKIFLRAIYTYILTSRIIPYQIKVQVISVYAYLRKRFNQ